MPQPRWAAVRAAALGCAALVLVASPVSADVTVTQVSTSRARGMPAPGLRRDVVMYLKGDRQRVDLGVTSSILDLDAGRFVILDHPARTATIYAIADLRPKQENVAQVRADVELATKTRAIGGLECQEAKVSIVSVDPRRSMGWPAEGFQPNRNVTTGSVWVATNAPGAEEYRAFYRRLDKLGAIVTNFDMARRQPAEAVAQAKLAIAIGSRGIPCAAQLSSRSQYGLVGFEYVDAIHSNGWEIKSVSTAPLADSLFEVPEGYTARRVGQ